MAGEFWVGVLDEPFHNARGERRFAVSGRSTDQNVKAIR
jgi:hypothetical protein